MACFVEWAISLFGGLVDHGVVGPVGPVGLVALLVFHENFFAWGLFDLFLGTGCDLLESKSNLTRHGVRLKPVVSLWSAVLKSWMGSSSLSLIMLSLSSFGSTMLPLWSLPLSFESAVLPL